MNSAPLSKSHMLVSVEAIPSGTSKAKRSLRMSQNEIFGEINLVYSLTILVSITKINSGSFTAKRFFTTMILCSN